MIGLNEDDDRERMQQAAAGPMDCVLDILPPSAPSTAARAAISRLVGLIRSGLLRLDEFAITKFDP